MNPLVFLAAHPDVAAVTLFLAALTAHVAVGAALHLVRLHDFDWHKLGAFVEQDMATARGLVILTTFLLDVLTRVVSATTPPQTAAELRLLVMPAVVSLVAACGASVLPILRDTLRELMQLVSGTNPKPARLASAPSAR